MCGNLLTAVMEGTGVGIGDVATTSASVGAPVRYVAILNPSWPNGPKLRARCASSGSVSVLLC